MLDGAFVNMLAKNHQKLKFIFDILDTFPKSMEDESSSSSISSCLFVSIDPMGDSQCLETLTHDDLFSSNSPSPNDIPPWPGSLSPTSVPPSLLSSLPAYLTSLPGPLSLFTVSPERKPDNCGPDQVTTTH